jgi:hypothetical protein
MGGGDVSKTFHATAALRKRLGLPPSWHPFAYEAVEGGMKLDGSLSIVDAEGKRHWAAHPITSGIVTDAEIASAGVEYEDGTGKCGFCLGGGG